MFEYSNGRFIAANKIIGANVYNKDTGNTDDNGNRITEVRVALDIDTVNKDKACVYAGPFQNEMKAKEFIKTIPISEK